MDIFFRKKKQNNLVTALIKNEPVLITQALQKIKNVDFVIDHPYFADHTPLSMVVTAGSVPAVQMLLEHGANPNVVIFKDPLLSDHHSSDLVPSSPLYLAVSNSKRPEMQQVYNLLRAHRADMFCNKPIETDFGLLNTNDDVHFSVQTKLEQKNLGQLWQEWEDDYQALRMKGVLQESIGETTAPVRKSKM